MRKKEAYFAMTGIERASEMVLMTSQLTGC
jgi:hypothetical protein